MAGLGMALETRGRTRAAVAETVLGRRAAPWTDDSPPRGCRAGRCTTRAAFVSLLWRPGLRRHASVRALCPPGATARWQGARFVPTAVVPPVGRVSGN